MTALVLELSELYLGTEKLFRITLKDPVLWPSVFTDFRVSAADPQIQALTGRLLDVDGTEEITANAGGHLLDELLKDPQISRHLLQMLDSPGPDPQPIYISFNTTDLEGLPWEAVFASQTQAPRLADSERFLGLARWPVGRTLSATPTPPELTPFQPPLRIACVLSCLGVSAAQEWEAITTALSRPGAVAAEVLLLVGEPEMLSVAGSSVPGSLTVEMLPDAPADLQRRITAFAPHVLHFFCHGSADDGGHLILSPAADHASGSSDDPLIIEDGQLTGMAPPTVDPPWLLVLNCCEGAVGTAGQESLGARLVQRGPFPVVVAMREPVLSQDATRFTGAFYDRLLPEIGDRVRGTAAGPWNWPDLLVSARREVARTAGSALSAAARTHRAWTLPVMYVSRPDFQVPMGVPGPRADRLELDLLRGLLPTLPADSPPALLQEINDRISVLAGSAPR